jgi:hypothetical protein
VIEHPEFPSTTSAYVSFCTPEYQADYDRRFGREPREPRRIYSTPLEDRDRLLERLRRDNDKVGRTLVARYELVEVVELDEA